MTCFSLCELFSKTWHRIWYEQFVTKVNILVLVIECVFQVKKSILFFAFALDLETSELLVCKITC